MKRKRLTESLKTLVRGRARGRCEYCQLPEKLSGLTHVIDHVIAHQHRGETSEANLALCCGHCNLSKGPNLSVLDPKTGAVTRLFNPRSDVWAKHFRWRGPTIVGISGTGRTTIVVLAMNVPSRLNTRRTLQVHGKLPLD